MPGKYVSLSGLYLFPSDSEVHDPNQGSAGRAEMERENGLGVLGAVGSAFGERWQGELELGYRSSSETVAAGRPDGRNRSGTSRGTLGGLQLRSASLL